MSASESAKQVEKRLAILLKILRIVGAKGAGSLVGDQKTCDGGACDDFRRIWLIYPHSLVLLFKSQFLLGNRHSLLREAQAKDVTSIEVGFYTLNYLSEPAFSGNRTSIILRTKA